MNILIGFILDVYDEVSSTINKKKENLDFEFKLTMKKLKKDTKKFI